MTTTTMTDDGIRSNARTMFDSVCIIPAQECGVHFINQGEGYIINNQQAAAATADNEAERCVWGFVV